ncbi:quaternary amine ABC transporter ATP-binding protein [Fodinicurvata sediminis]|uniref:quaternary amine ABC transporter ATP-binding protein n=1 Tax=Fodinicurvata sediminis TaxID=1121832 RepID=UPI0003B6F2F1|nr:glycine betaine/L-proline ABC transporter ATP-binding protein [Fodinicurvata sediminis]
MTDKLVVKNLFKVFGPDPDQAVELAKQGVAKDEIYRQTESVVAVNDVSLSVKERELFVVMGLSGSGKSTLIRCFNRLIDPTSGEILIDGESLTNAGEEELRQLRKNKMSMVFQHFALFPHKTVCENAEYGLKVRGISRRERREKAMAALEAVGLDAWADAYPDNLSGGMQQRVGLARGLAVDPEVLLMDEPFSALDPLIRREMQDELAGIQEKYKTTIIFITHDLHEALKLGDHIAIMKDGRFVQVGPPEEIVTAPADDYVSAFTHDVDRGRVLRAESVMEAPVTLQAGKDTASSALARMDEAGQDCLYVVDEKGQPAGYIRRAMLADLSGDTKITDVMESSYPRTDPDRLLFELYEQCAEGVPVAVQSEDGKFLGVVQPSQVFTELVSDETATESQDKAPAGAAQ